MFCELFFTILLTNDVFSATFTTQRAEDAAFWRQHAETHLRKILAQLNDGHSKSQSQAKNIIIFIGDGMGLSTITASRIYKGQQKGRSGEEETLIFDEFPHIGLAKTYNVDKQVPDSAGTATAMFTGVKTNYGVLGLDAVQSKKSNPEFAARLPSIMDWALSVKKKAGFVTTTRVTHATPGALYSHTPSRDWECDSKIPANERSQRQDIARQLIENDPGRRLNVILAGGKQMMGSMEAERVTDQPKFNGSTEKACERLDGRNLIQEWLQLPPTNKRTFVSNTGELLAIKLHETDHLLGLFAQNHMSYSTVRNKGPSGEPSLAQMTKTAISVLRNEHANGFVLMVEGGRIDQAHHQNLARLALQEVLEMDEAIQVALNETSRSDTLIIVTADHSHAVTLNGYPARGNDILGFANKPNVQPYETLTYANGPGFLRHRLNQSEEQQGRDRTWLRVNLLTDEDRLDPLYQHQAMLSLEDETHGGEDVAVYGIGPGAELIRGSFEQNYIAYIMSYAGCMGPARDINKGCKNGSDGSPVSLVATTVFTRTNPTIYIQTQNKTTREAQAALFNINSNSGWLLLNYVGPSTVHFAAGGEGGADEFVNLFEDDQIQYALVRIGGIQEKGTLKTTFRDVFIKWIGPEVGTIEKGKKVRYQGDAEAFLQPFHAAITALNKARINYETILDRSHPLSGSHVID